MNYSIIPEMNETELELFFTQMLADEQAYLERIREEATWSFEV
jgi:hypothetical protein